MEITKNGLDFDSLTHCWRSQNFDPKLDRYKSLIYPDLSMDHLMSIGPHFIYIFDCSNSQLHYLSENVSKILGYDHQLLLSKGRSFLMEILHPDEASTVVQSIIKSWEFIKSVPVIHQKSYKVSYDFRIRKSDGNYIRLLQQHAVMNLDKKGNILFVLGVCTDITHWHKDNQLTLSIVGPEEEQSFFCVSSGKKQEVRQTLSGRQKQILILLSEGFCSREISEQLNISHHTVNVHRRNMLDKLKLNNTISLVKFAISHQII